jgi:hypothetical protein
VGFYVTDQLIRCFAFTRNWRKNGNTMRLHQLFIDFKKAYDSVRREVVYNIVIKFGVPMKIVRLIKMCLNEIYSEVHVGKHFLYVSYSKWSKTRRCFIAIAFQVRFRIHH